MLKRNRNYNVLQIWIYKILQSIEIIQFSLALCNKYFILNCDHQLFVMTFSHDNDTSQKNMRTKQLLI